MLNSSVTFIWLKHSVKERYHQFVSNFPWTFQSCTTASFSWRVGSDGQSLPIFSRLPDQFLPSVTDDKRLFLLRLLQATVYFCHPSHYFQNCQHLLHWLHPEKPLQPTIVGTGPGIGGLPYRGLLACVKLWQVASPTHLWSGWMVLVLFESEAFFFISPAPGCQPVPWKPCLLSPIVESGLFESLSPPSQVPDDVLQPWYVFCLCHWCVSCLLASWHCGDTCMSDFFMTRSTHLHPALCHLQVYDHWQWYINCNWPDLMYNSNDVKLSGILSHLQGVCSLASWLFPFIS